MNISKLFTRLSVVIMLVSAFLSALGLLWDGLYQDTNTLILTGWRINDWVTLLVAVPLFAVAIYMTKKELLPGYALLIGLNMYTVYNYSFYLFGAAFNAAFIGYVLLFVLGIFGLILGAVYLFKALGRQHFPKAKTAKWISAYMFLIVFFLSVGWIGQWFDFVLTGKVPELMERFGTTIHLVAALDLTFVVPWFFVGAVLLWRQQISGLIIAFMVHMKTVIYNIILLFGSISQMTVGVDGESVFILFWVFFIVASTVSLIFLGKPLNKKTTFNNMNKVHL